MDSDPTYTLTCDEPGKRANGAIYRRPPPLEPLAERLPIRNQAGGLIYPDLFRKSWDRALKRLGLPDYNPHDLRHKWATLTLSNGVPIHEVSRWMGHSSIKITVDRYGHLTLDGSERCRRVRSGQVRSDHRGRLRSAHAQRIPSSASTRC
ncbi:tyrosine-type recombinase/integrase [Streptomyces tubercidicus]|uniref:tyrosine-type recombinase/integrase n=1 Tax=Streptomyces tubercidicus TaxID=47759 RepID=UPI0030DFBE5C|nr:tyrosine-type recombinase/integrase [Streptomyces tubercidicus]